MICGTVHQVLAQENFCAGGIRGTFSGAHTGRYGLWRLESSKIAGHWDVMKTIAEKDT